MDQQGGGVHEQLYIVDHQGDQEAGVGSSLHCLLPYIWFTMMHLQMSCFSTTQVQEYNTLLEIISHSSTQQFFGKWKHHQFDVEHIITYKTD